MATEEKTTFGLTLDPAAAASEKTLTPKPSKDSELSGSRTPVSAAEGASPFSAFYSHGSARRSREEPRPAVKAPGIAVYEADLEGQPLTHAATVNPATMSEQHLHQHPTESSRPKLSVDGRVKECPMWPSRERLQAEEKQRRRQRRSCGPLRKLSSKQRLWLKIFIGLLIVAAAVGLGVGISRAVGGGVWSGRGQSKPIPDGKPA